MKIFFLKYSIIGMIFFLIPYSEASDLSSNNSTLDKNSNLIQDNQEYFLKGLPSSWKAIILDKPIIIYKNKEYNNKSHDSEQKNTELKFINNIPKISSNRILIPIPPHMGIAAYRSGNRFVIVIDNNQIMDTSALRGDGIFSKVFLQNFPDATLIQIPLPDTRMLYLTQQAEGWILGDKPPPGNSYDDRLVINPKRVDEGILYPLRRPGRVLKIKDPASGEDLLVGTSISDNGGILSLRKGEGYNVWPTLEGVVIESKSHDIGMKATPAGDLLTWNGQKLPDSSKAVYASDVDYDWLGLRDQSLAQQRKRYHDAIIKAADSDPAGRFQARVEVAKAAFSMGAFMDTRAILNVSLEDDPEGAMRPDVRFLQAATELLLGNYSNAVILDDQWPDDQKRAVQVWRGLYLNAVGGHVHEAAHLLARDFDRLKSYPQMLQDVVISRAAEQIARYGSPEDSQVLNDLPNAKFYQLVQALEKVKDAKQDEAYPIFKSLSKDRNILVSENASEEIAKLDLLSKKTNPEDIANKLGELVFDARRVGREPEVRLLQANAYIHAGKWDEALAAADHVSSIPHDTLFKILASISAARMQSSDKNSLLRGAASLHSHLDIFPTGDQKGELLIAYGKMLTSLGLLDRASQAYSDAIPMLSSPKLRAQAGANLADVFLKRQLPDKASLALSRTDDSNLPDDMKGMRRRIAAQVALQKGDQITALGLLDDALDQESLQMKVGIHEGKEEWGAAVSELKRIAENAIPPEGELSDEQQTIALRLATDAVHANDDLNLAWIYQLIGDRNMTPDNKKLFLLLTRQKKLYSPSKK